MGVGVEKGGGRVGWGGSGDSRVPTGGLLGDLPWMNHEILLPQRHKMHFFRSLSLRPGLPSHMRATKGVELMRLGPRLPSS